MAGEIVKLPQREERDTPPLATIAQPENTYRNRRRDYGGATPESVSAALTQLLNGILEPWVDLSGHMVRFDGHLRSIYYTRRQAIAGAPFEIVPGIARTPVDEPLAAQAAQFITLMLQEQRDFEAWSLNMMDAIGRGFAVSELIYTREAGAWVPRPHWLHARRFRIDPEYNVRLYDNGTVAGSNGYGRAFEPDKWIVFTPSTVAEHIVDSGELLACVWWWLLKTWGRRFWAVAADRFGSPRAIGTLPQNATGTARAALLAALEKLANDASGIVEEGTRIEIAPPMAQSTGEMWDRFIEFNNAEMSKAMLGATDLTEPGPNGARAATETRNGVRLERAEADAKMWAGCLEQNWFGPALKFNAHLFGGRVPPTPQIKFNLVENVVEVDQVAVDAGAVTLDELRAARGLDPLGDERGAALIPAKTAAPSYGMAQAPAAGGGPAAEPPFSARRKAAPHPHKQMKLGIGSPSPTRSDLPSPLARALRGR